MMTLRPRPLALATLLALGTTSGWADTTDYTFSGLYNTFWDGSFVVLPYTGSFAISGATATPDRPAMAPDVTLAAYAGIWAGSSEFYNGAHHLQITFANGATVAADVLDVVVNNTSFQGDGSPYPLGLSVQVDTRGAVALGMTASQVCPDGSVDDDCDSSGDDAGVEPALLARREDALAGHRKGGGAQRDLVAVGGVPDVLQRADHDLVQAHVDLVLGPEEAAEVLHPLEVAHRHAAGVADHVGHHQHAAVGQDVVGRRHGGPLAPSSTSLAFSGGAGGGDLAFQRGRDQDVAVHVPELLVAHHLAPEAGHAAAWPSRAAISSARSKPWR
jgi:hypothetical protein